MENSVARNVGAQCERLGYASFWLNNPPGGDAIPTLGAVARLTASIQLGIGIIPLSHTAPDAIVDDVSRNALPLHRLYLGVGSGSGLDGVRRVREGVEALRSRIQTEVVVAALGPAMCRLAGRQADGVLLNWLTPGFARQASEWVREGAEAAGKPMPRVMVYVRAAIGDAARRRLDAEAARYEAIPQYAAHFERMGASALQTSISASSPAELQEALLVWDGVVDEVVVRVIPSSDTVDDVLAIASAAAQQPGR
jgi:alkanesulfonate monooxygenase SsuD/methylene tetrahydromethanopterin reductase-like flavin-dependent oxidoreductase (luciferase family)